MSKRFKGYFYYRERDSEEIPWLRPDSPELLELPRPIVLINGAFDILHTPHMRLIFSAAEKGTVICALDSDQRIRRSKGPERPILSFVERAAALNYMPVASIVEIDTDTDMKQLIHYLKPNLRVQGTEYRDRESKFKIRKMLVRDGKPHTTDLIERILTRYDLGKNT